MSSTLGCIGLSVDDTESLDALVGRLLPDAAVVARSGELQARRWVDASGASLTMTVRQSGDDEGVLVDIVPSYVAPTGGGAGHDGVRLGSLSGYGDVLAADLVDDAGTRVLRVACDLAQSIVTEVSDPRPAHLTALGLDLTVHADAAAFAASDESVISTPGPGQTPLRFATESLLAYGLSEDAAKAQPTAFVSGTVLSVSSQTNAETGQGFHTARLLTSAGHVTACLAAGDHPDPPRLGNVLSGVCYLVLDVPDL
ncbi:hypothetical protein [Nocardioides sp.]|uniref:hypothetical protein n=1 Tax=Nocardioides sp. TaxID=35761 RepID=UPI002B26BAF7|nr:hypothetical protein [Nocardioides sp.]